MNVPLLRQVVAFAYLTYIPGLILLKILRFDQLKAEEEILYAVGLSVAFLMIFGVVINELLPIVGLSKPLTLMPIMLSISHVLLLLSYFVPSGSNILPKFSNLSRVGKFSVCLPIIGLFGIFTLRRSGDNSILLFLIFIISALVIIGALKIRDFTSSDCSLLVLAIAFALFFGLSIDLLCEYVHGPGDQPLEYYAFQLTEMNSRWYSESVPSSDLELFPTYSMISVTILPSIFSVLLGVNGEWVMNILYTFIVSFVPLGAYLLYRTQTNGKTAFLATFFLIVIATGKSWGPVKQMVALLFFEMLFLLMVEKKLSVMKQSILFIVLGSALVISHYATSYLFLYIISFAWVALRILRKKEKISTTLIIIFFTICLSWYIFVTKSATFDNFVNVLNIVWSKATSGFWSLESRGTAAEGLGLLDVTSTTNLISGIFFYVSEGLIVIGFIKMIFRRHETKFSLLYTIFVSASISILFLNVLVPGLADTYLMSRFYVTTIMIAAPLFVLGGETIVKFVPKLKKKENIVIPLIMLELIPLFLFQTGFLFALTGAPTTSVIGINNWSETTRYIWHSDYWDINGAKWLRKHANTTSLLVYSDWPAKSYVLNPYCMIDRNRVQTLSNTTRIIEYGSFIYLTHFNNKAGLLLINYPYNKTEISHLLDVANQVYSNGNSTIYQGLGD